MNAMVWAFLVWLGLAVSVMGESDRVVYQESFDNWRNPEQYLRIAKGVKRWEVIREGGEVFLRVHACPTATRPEILVVWDLAPIQFRKLGVKIRPNLSEAAIVIYVQATLDDRAGIAYAGRYFGGTLENDGRGPLRPGEWNLYELVFPRDLLGASQGGRALLSPSGEALGSVPDFSNVGYKTIYFNFRLPPDSPLLGKHFTIDLLNLNLTESNP